MDERLTPEALIALLAYTGSLFLMFVYHFYRATRRWRRRQDIPAFRSWIISVMLAVATATIFAGSLARLIPELIDAVRFFGYVVRGMLLLGGVIVVWTWRRDDQ